MKTLTILFPLWMLCAAFATADVTLPAFFSSHMVVQQKVPVPIWGWADPDERVTVTVLSGTRNRMMCVSTLANARKQWRITLDPLEAGGPLTLKVQGKNRIILEDVLVGEVWICSGQSNMEFPVKRADDAGKEMAGARYPGIRLFTIPRIVSNRERRDCRGSWVACSPETVGGFSAVAYFFGRAVHGALKVPVGLIHTSWGGSPAEAWTRRKALAGNPMLRPILERFKKAVARYPEAMKNYKKKVAVWKEKRAEAHVAGKRPPPRPRAPFGPGHRNSPSGLFNGMIAPLIPMAFQGVIWYQGEANASRAFQYRTLFSTMIRDWRNAWGRGDFPFLFVQLANFKKRKPAPAESAWAELREAQAMALKLPRTGMALAIDIGMANDIHPRNKQDVGKRLALQALQVAYGRKGVHTGPTFARMKRGSGKIRLVFTNVGGGLVTRGKALLGFQIAGSNRKYAWAKARFLPGRKDVVEVWNSSVKNPLHVRYGWADNPACTLYNREGLPAVPFRTDSWPGLTVDNR